MGTKYRSIKYSCEIMIHRYEILILPRNSRSSYILKGWIQRLFYCNFLMRQYSPTRIACKMRQPILLLLFIFIYIYFFFPLSAPSTLFRTLSISTFHKNSCKPSFFRPVTFWLLNFNLFFNCATLNLARPASSIVTNTDPTGPSLPTVIFLSTTSLSAYLPPSMWFLTRLWLQHPFPPGAKLRHYLALPRSPPYCNTDRKNHNYHTPNQIWF